MRIEYIIVSVIIFLVVLVAVLSFGKEIIPTFSSFVDNFRNILH